MEKVMVKLDYAPHYIAADQKLKEAYELILKKRYIEASTLLDEVAVEVRLMRIAVKSHVE